MSLGPDARALLGLAGSADDPSEADAARVRAKLAARIGLSAAAGAAATLATKSAAAGGAATLAAKSATATSILPAATTTAAAGGATAGGAATGAVAGGMSAGAKLLLAAAIASGAATSAVVVSSSREAAPIAAPAPNASLEWGKVPAELGKIPQPPIVPREIASEAKPTPARSSSPAIASSPPPPPTGGVATPLPKKIEAKTPSTPGTDGARPTRASGKDAPPGRSASLVEPVDAVAEEAAILRSAQAALARGDSTTALGRLDEHAQRFPHGVLGEEEVAARVLGLCAAGRASEARALGAAFLAKSPRSPLASQVKRSCASRP
jgi:hypothetical protein